MASEPSPEFNLVGAAPRRNRFRHLKLHSPAGKKPVLYRWPIDAANPHDVAADIVDTIKFVMNNIYNQDQFHGVKLVLPSEDQMTNFAAMHKLVTDFNEMVNSFKHLNHGKTENPFYRRAEPEALHYIIEKVYRISVTQPRLLNRYRAFSTTVYGEISLQSVQEIIGKVEASLGEADTAVDLGSGIGQVVLHFAGSLRVRTVWGIEFAEIPSRYAKAMGRNFKRWMDWCGFTYSPFQLVRGDFLRTRHRGKILGSKLIFANDHAFGAETTHALKGIFADLSSKATVVSLRSYGPRMPLRSVNVRNQNELSTIIQKDDVVPCGVSWTSKLVDFHIQIVDSSSRPPDVDEKGTPNEEVRPSNKSRRAVAARTAGTGGTKIQDENNDGQGGAVRRTGGQGCCNHKRSISSGPAPRTGDNRAPLTMSAGRKGGAAKGQRRRGKPPNILRGVLEEQNIVLPDPFAAAACDEPPPRKRKKLSHEAEPHAAVERGPQPQPLPRLEDDKKTPLDNAPDAALTIPRESSTAGTIAPRHVVSSLVTQQKNLANAKLDFLARLGYVGLPPHLLCSSHHRQALPNLREVAERRRQALKKACETTLSSDDDLDDEDDDMDLEFLNSTNESSSGRTVAPAVAQQTW